MIHIRSKYNFGGVFGIVIAMTITSKLLKNIVFYFPKEYVSLLIGLVYISTVVQFYMLHLNV